MAFCDNMHSLDVKREFLLVRDASKRKRLNRTAKLKQYKLDARREQWLGKLCSRSGQNLQRQEWKGHEHKEGEITSGVSEQDISPNSEESDTKGFKTLSEEFTTSVSEESESGSSVVIFYEDHANSSASGSSKDDYVPNDIFNVCGPFNIEKTKSKNGPSDRSSVQREATSVLGKDDCSRQNCVNDKSKSKNSKEQRKACGLRNALKPSDVIDSLSQMKQRRDQVKDWLSSTSVSLTSDSVVSAGSKSVEGSLDEEDWEAVADALYAKFSIDGIESYDNTGRSNSVKCSVQGESTSVLSKDDCSRRKCVNDIGKSKNSKERRKACGLRNALKPLGTIDSLSQMKRRDQVKDWLRSDTINLTSSRVSTGSKSMEGSVDQEDWEAVGNVAAVLYAKTSIDGKESCAKTGSLRKVQEFIPTDRQHRIKEIRHSDSQTGLLKPDDKPKLNPFFRRSSSTSSCAWRPDDVSRPPTLPSPRKQQRTPQNSSSALWSPGFVKIVWPTNSVLPADCPICAEELDSTDSSFVPCPCGFRPCLFCVHRLASEDGRCPGCRRDYSFNIKSLISSSS